MKKPPLSSEEFKRPSLLTDANLDDLLIYSFDIGKGTVQGFSSDFRKIITFEPVMAPLTNKRSLALDTSEESKKPRFSLRENGQVSVFGVQDVIEHGKYGMRRRLSSLDIYLSEDYYRMFKVMLFQAFKKYAGNSDWIRPSGAISVPVVIYDNDEIMGHIKDAIIGKHEITDAEGCTLRVEITESRFLIVPEGRGAAEQRCYDPATLQRREDVSSAGSTIIVDAGYETVNETLFHGMKYIRDISYTFERAGFGVIVRAIHAWAADQLKGVDDSRIDIGLRAIAGIPLGREKYIEIAQGVSIDVQPIYDVEIVNFADRLAQDIATRFADVAANRIGLSGGTAHHILPYLTRENTGWDVEVVPNPEVANALGLMTKLFRQATKNNE